MAELREEPAGILYETAALAESGTAISEQAVVSADAGPPDVGLSDLLESLAAAGIAESPRPTAGARAASGIDRARTVRELLTALFGRPSRLDREQVLQSLTVVIGRIDELLNSWINGILHHPEFQRLEASWRGLRYLVSCVSPDFSQSLKVRVYNCSKSDLARDLDRATEFDQSEAFRKIYDAEFGTSGGQPFGLLIGDYSFTQHPDDLQMLHGITSVAAAAFAPFVTAAAPELFKLDSFRDLERISSLEETFNPRRDPNYIKWSALRDHPDSRFLGLVVPRILLRPPYADVGRPDGFRFQESTVRADTSEYLWGNGAYAFGEVAIRAFEESGWLANVRGVEAGRDSGGVVTRLPTYWFETDTPGVVPRQSTEIVVTEQQDQALSRQGFLALCQCYDTPYSAFLSSPSVHRPENFGSNSAATRNAEISAMLRYMLCVSQFARALKVLARDKIGSLMEPYECEQLLSNWLNRYVTPDEDASQDVKAKFPLREGRVEVKPHASKPGHFKCVTWLQPHFELDDMSVGLHLTTDLVRG